MASLRIEPPLLWTAATIFPAVCIVVVGLRLIGRRAQKMPLGVDDWLSLAALVLVLGMAATILAGVAQGALGYPTPPSPPGEVLEAESFKQTVTRKAYAAITLLQTAALCFIKLSCILFYRRVFWNGLSRVVQSLLLVLAVLVVVWGIGFFCAFLFACDTHFDYLWTNLVNQLMCPANLSQIDLSLSISDFVIDFILLLFPLPLVWRLQISRVKKAAIIGILMLGASAVAMSITRMAIVIEELNVEFASTADEDFVSTDALYFMFIEACFALCAICLPSVTGAAKFKPIELMMHSIGSVLSYASGRSRGSRGSHGSHGARSIDTAARTNPPVAGGRTVDASRNNSSAYQAALGLDLGLHKKHIEDIELQERDGTSRGSSREQTDDLPKD